MESLAVIRVQATIGVRAMIGVQGPDLPAVEALRDSPQRPRAWFAPMRPSLRKRQGAKRTSSISSIGGTARF